MMCKNKNKNYRIKDIKKVNKNDSTVFYIVNLDTEGYILIASPCCVNPIIGYSYTSTFENSVLNESTKLWVDALNQWIVKKKEKNNKIPKLKNISQTIPDATIIKEQKLNNLNVAPLLEFYLSSRWAYWYPYSTLFPNQYGDKACVPIALSQIMKYHGFPLQGRNSFNSVDFSREWYDFNNMPFRLTHCGNGQENCNEGDFNILPDVSESNWLEISKLIYHAGISVNTNWTNTDFGGTYGNGGDWAQKLYYYFYYKPTFTHNSPSYIAENYSTFKESLRNELLLGYPVLFAHYPTSGGGHALVIDGFECNEYFHFAMGRGGFSDAYYYLYDIDADDIHNISPLNSFYDAVIGIRPDCSDIYDLALSNTIISQFDNLFYQINGLCTLNNLSINSGGRLTIQATNGIVLNPGFEAQLGCSLFFQAKKCGH